MSSQALPTLSLTAAEAGMPYGCSTDGVTAVKVAGLTAPVGVWYSVESGGELGGMKLGAETSRDGALGLRVWVWKRRVRVYVEGE